MSKEIVKYNNKMNKIPLKNFEKIDMNFFMPYAQKLKMWVQTRLKFHSMT